MTAAATFMPTVGQAREAGFFPSRHTVEIVDNRMLADGVYRLTFRDEFIAGHAKPAQFVDVYSNNPSRLMPRPFGVAEVDGDEVSLIFAVVGKGTAEFSELRAGDTIRVMGPLGNSFNTLSLKRYKCLSEISLFLVNLKHLIPECKSMLLIVCGSFAKHHNRNNCILIPCMCTYKTAVALFKTKYIFIRMILFK